jgi:excisionase family DNA binding protein
MKAELESHDIDAIAYKVVELIKPMLSGNDRQRQEDLIFDVKGLSEYLKVDTSWIYKHVSLKSIPHFKVGKYTRFRKKDIEKWIESHKIPSLTPLKLLKKAV